MIKPIVILFLLIISSPFASQEKALLTKEETVNYINKKLEETHRILFEYKFEIITQYRPSKESFTTDHMHIMSNVFRYDQDGYISHRLQLANMKESCASTDFSFGSKSSEVRFKPNHITKVEEIQTHDQKVGALRLTFLPNTDKWEKDELWYKIKEEKPKRVYSHTDIWGNAQYVTRFDVARNCEKRTAEHSPKGELIVYFFKSDPENSRRLQRAFQHLIDLYKAEDDPFGD